MFKRISAWFIILGLAAILGACSSNEASDKSKEDASKETKNEEAVATVNGKEILKSDYENSLKSAKATYEQQGIKLDSKTEKEMETGVLDQLINTELVRQSAEAEDISIKQSQVDSELANIKSQFEDDAKYKEALKQNKVTEEELKKQVKQQMVITEYLDGAIGKVTVTEDEVKVIYDQYKAQTESQDQKAEKFETVKAQLEQQAIAQKKNEKVNQLVEDLRKKNEENIKIL
ncbi:SurA N-terminal domain-containing protein [Mesobacillus foraminis]|uniref:SurA N-terminal domain-containing protein n=1 Tax=Mesobacillus foraminis TaxID=279826 RepID=UPI001BE792DC|nr:SurA N-terminal domain-containing protein [Mesobacillus foraminis]MBT2757397.1 SurA N-terminal domain-containing protein [Mesobacillus foraminis]